MAISYRIVSRPMAISHRILLCPTAISYQIVSKKTDKIVSCNIVDKPNLSLTKHITYSFPSAYILNVNGIDFTFHSPLYFDLQHWIRSLLPLLRLLVSSIRLEFFYFLVVMIPRRAIVYNLL